jgi:glycosyltransferase involved in cell wall biosynthesis
MTLTLARMADAILLYSHEMKERLVRHGLDERKLLVALNTVDVCQIQEAKSQLNRDNLVRDRVLYIGRLIPAKKVDLLIRAFALASRSLPPLVRLTIVGDGPCRSELQALANELGLAERVEFCGEITNETVLAGVFAESWLSVSPGYVGLAAIHSLAYGVPMVVARGEPHSPEVSALREGVTSVYFERDSIDLLAATMVDLWVDSDRRNALARAGQELVERDYAIENMASAFDSAVSLALRSGGACG